MSRVNSLGIKVPERLIVQRAVLPSNYSPLHVEVRAIPQRRVPLRNA